MAGGIEIVGAAGNEAGIARRAERRGEPRLVIEPDAHQQISRAQARDVARLELDRVRILQRRGQTLDADAVAADDLDQPLEIGRGRDDGEGAAALGAGGPGQRGGDGDGPKSRYDFFAKADFGIMQCTPLRTSTTWLTRQSPIIEVSE